MQVPVFAVESSNLEAVGYDAELEVLAVQFKPRSGKQKGPRFHYHGVKPDVYEELLNAVSCGSFYAARIKGKYHGERVTGPCSVCGEEGPIGEACVVTSEAGEPCGGTHRGLERRYEGTSMAVAAIVLAVLL